MTADNPILEKELLAGLPAALRKALLAAYAEILRNYRERRWEPAELNGGKLCEVVYTILRGCIDGKFPRKSSKPKNMVDACRALEQEPATHPRSIRIQVPRMLLALYEIRNNRGVGHVGGDVDPNHMDASCVVEMSKWLMSELVRILHGVDTEEAAAAVDRLVERTNPVVWKVGNNLRVLDLNMSTKGKMLLLLHHSPGPVQESDLFRWLEYSNLSVLRRDVIRRAHRDRLVEYDPVAGTVVISPLGIGYVEESLPG